MFSLPCNHTSAGHVSLSKQYICSNSLQHTCWVYENQYEHKTVLVPYVLEGLKNNEKVAIVHAVHTEEEILAYFDEELQIEKYIASGQMVLMDSDEVYCPAGLGFVPEIITQKFSDFVDLAIQQGYTKLRAYGDMGFANKVDTQKLVQYESEMAMFFAEKKDRVVGVCSYPSTMFDGSLIVSMMATHPKLFIGTENFDTNFYFVPNVTSLSMNTVAEYWISNLRERKALQNALIQKNTELTDTNAVLKGEIEERERAQIEKKAAEDSNKTKRAFIATLSHEIRTPLFGILSTAALLRDTALQGEQTEYVSMIDAIGEHLITVLNDVLDYSKVFYVCTTVTITEFDQENFKIKATGSGEKFNKKKHGSGTEIKAITYSNMQIHHDSESAEVYVIVDI